MQTFLKTITCNNIFMTESPNPVDFWKNCRQLVPLTTRSQSIYPSVNSCSEQACNSHVSAFYLLVLFVCLLVFLFVWGFFVLVFFWCFFPLDWRRGGRGVVDKISEKPPPPPPPLLFFLNGYSSSGKLGLTDWSWNIPQTILIIK